MYKVEMQRITYVRSAPLAQELLSSSWNLDELSSQPSFSSRVVWKTQLIASDKEDTFLHV